MGAKVASGGRVVVVAVLLCGCALDDAPEEGLVGDAVAREHCVVGAVPVGDDGDAAAPGEPRCFTSLAESLAFAAAEVARNLSPAVPPPPAGYVLEILYDGPLWSGPSLVVTAGAACSPYLAWQLPALPDPTWDERVSSVYRTPMCNHAWHHEHVGFAGAVLDCGTQDCYRDMGAMNDRTSSIRWTY